MLQIDGFSLPKLKRKQQDFVKAVPLYKDNLSAAYRYAYNCKNMSSAAINVEASRLAKNPNVALWLDFYRQRAAKIIENEFNYSVQDAMREYNELQQLSMRSYKTYNVAKGCIDGKCRIAGLDKSQNAACASFTVNMGSVEVDGNKLEFNIGNNFNDSASENS